MRLDEQIKIAIAAAPIGAAAVDNTGMIQLCNQLFADLLGRSRTDIEGRITYQQITHPDDLADDTGQHRALIEGRITRYEIEKRYIRPSGQVVWVNLVVGFIGEGESGYSLAYANDISDLKLAEVDQKLRGEIVEAIARRDFALWYQPIMRLATGKIEAQEALIRWPHPSGLRYPDFFLPAARRFKLEPYLCRLVMELASEQLKVWSQSHITRDWAIAINVEPTTLGQPFFEEMLERAIALHSVPTERLWLEIIEVQAVDLDQLNDRLLRLSGKHHIAIDDYGTGYSNLQSLGQYPVMAVKLDRSLVTGVDGSARMATVLESTIRLAHDLNLEVIAEGVETAADLDWLQQHDCDYGQGYYLGRPAPAGI